MVDPSHNLKKRMKAGIRKVQEEVTRPKRYPAPSVVPCSLHSTEMKKERYDTKRFSNFLLAFFIKIYD